MGGKLFSRLAKLYQEMEKIMKLYIERCSLIDMLKECASKMNNQQIVETSLRIALLDKLLKEESYK